MLILGTTGCPGGVRCKPPFKYDGRRLAIEATNGNIAVGGNTSVENIRQVDVAVERYSARYMSLCNDYRNGAIPQEEYAAESREMRLGFAELEKLYLLIDSAPTDAAQVQEALLQIQQAATMRGSSGALEVGVAVYTQGPEDPGFSLSPQGRTLGSGSRIYFELQASIPAYVYLYQTSPNGELALLFPDDAIPIPNPLPPNQAVRLPHGAFTYDVDNENIGMENIHVVVSAQPLNSLADTALTDSSAGTVADNDLDCGTRGVGLSAPPTCNKTRGVKLSANPSSESVRAKADSGDDAVHVVYNFHHVGDQKVYATKNGRGVEMLTGDAAQATRQNDIDACPGEGELKHM